MLVTVGSGLREPQGRRSEVGTIADLLRAADLRDAAGPEVWWSPHLWAGDYRRTERWEQSVGVAIDLDYYSIEGGRSAPPIDTRDRLAALVGGLGVRSIGHATPRGHRLIIPFDVAASDGVLYQRAARSVGAMVEQALSDAAILGGARRRTLGHPLRPRDRPAGADRPRADALASL